MSAALEGFRLSQASLVLLCARGQSDPALVRPFVLGLDDAEIILVAGDRPDERLEREGDRGGRGYYLEPSEGNERLLWVMTFIMRTLGILPPARRLA